MSIEFIIIGILALILLELTVVIIVYRNDIIFKSASFLMRIGKYRFAIFLFKLLLGNKNVNDKVKFNIGMSYFELGDYDKAKDNFLSYIESGSENFEVFYNIGLVYLNEKNYIYAKNYFKKALEINHSDTDCLYQMGLIFFEEQDIEQALQYFKQAQVQAPDKIELQYCILRCNDLLSKYNDSKEEEEIIIQYKEFLPRRNLLKDFYLESAFISSLAKAGKIDEVIKASLAFLPVAKKQEHILYKLLGLSYFIKQDYVNALKTFIEAKKYLPDNFEINNIIAYYYYLQNDSAKHEYYTELAQKSKNKLPQTNYL